MSNYSPGAVGTTSRKYLFPSIGRTTLVIANAVILVVLCFYKLNPKDRWSFENIGYRTGFITMVQFPLVFLLAGKRNIIGALIGSSYERLNWLHRWASRTLLLTATIHMGYWFADWAPYDYIGTKITTDSITKRGVIAWSILVWIAISSMTPIRGWNYELFVVQHIISMVAFIAMVYLHTPAEVHVWIWICVGLFFLDRMLRGGWYVYNNTAIGRSKQSQNGSMGKLWAYKAEIVALSDNITKITIRDPSIKWNAGQHVFVTCQALAPLQAHPFTISSLPTDGKMEFIIQSRNGGTKRFRRHAEREHGLPVVNSDMRTASTSVTIEGPYGRIRPLKQFDSVVLLAGSTGATFTMPLLREIVQLWKHTALSQSTASSKRSVTTRRVKFVWVVKSGSQLAMFSEQLSEAMEDVKQLQESGQDVELNISVYITCDETFTTEQRSILEAIQQATVPAVPSHGTAVEAAPIESIDEKEHEKEKVNVRVSIQGKPQSCGPNGTCCCTADIEESSEDGDIRQMCTCNCGSSTTPESSRSSTISSLGKERPTKRSALHSDIDLFSGRPMPKAIIGRSLEKACGESAVVACGPRGLTNDVRMAVCNLSDERAVHKGTGAQGIWLHTEAFGY